MKKFIFLFSVTLISLFFFSFNEFIKSSSKNAKIAGINQQPTLKGTYKRTTWGLYTAFEFKGKSTVIVHSMKLEFVASYKIDDGFIRIEDGNSGMILLEMKNSTTLIGRGVAKGTYKK